MPWLVALLLAVPGSALPPDPGDVRTGLEELRAETVATVSDPKLQRGLTKAVDKATKKLDKAALKGTPRAFKKPRATVRSFLKKLGWKEKKGLLRPKKRQKLEPEISDPLRDRAAGLLALLDALIADAMEAPGAGVVGSAGGEVRSADGALTLAFPEGALPEGSALVTVRPLAPADLGPEFAGIDVGAAWELGPDGLEFAEPVEVEVSGLGLGGDGSVLLLHTASGGGRALVLEPGWALAGAEARATGRLEHFSTLAFEVADGIAFRLLNAPEKGAILRANQPFVPQVKAVTEIQAGNAFAGESFRYLDLSADPVETNNGTARNGTLDLGSWATGRALEREATVAYACEGAGPGTFEVVISGTLVRGSEQTNVTGRAMNRVFCEPDDVADGRVEIATALGTVEFEALPRQVARRVGESFDVAYLEVSAGFDAPEPPDREFLELFVEDLNPGVLSHPPELRGSAGPNAAGELRDFGTALATVSALALGPPDADRIANGASGQTLRWTCVEPGSTTLAHELAISSGSTFTGTTRAGTGHLATLVVCSAPPSYGFEDGDMDAEIVVLEDGVGEYVGRIGEDGDALDTISFEIGQPESEVTIVAVDTGDPDAAEVELRLTDPDLEDVACETDAGIEAVLPSGRYLLAVTPRQPGVYTIRFEIRPRDVGNARRPRGAPVDCDALCPQNGFACGSQNGGICVRGLCMVEVPMNAGVDGNAVCAAEGLTCSGVPALDFPEGEACLAFHPTALETFGGSGWRQSVYCNGAGGLACNGQVDVCWDCPACLADQLDCTTGASAELDALFASCE